MKRKIFVCCVIFALLTSLVGMSATTESSCKGKAYWINGSYSGIFGENCLMVKVYPQKKKIRLTGYYHYGKTSMGGDFYYINKLFKMKRGLKLRTVENERVHYYNAATYRYGRDENGYVFYPGINLLIKGNTIMKMGIYS